MKDVIITGILGLISLGMMGSCSKEEDQTVVETPSYDEELGYDTPLDTKGMPGVLENDTIPSHSDRIPKL